MIFWLGFLIYAVSQRSSGRLVDDTLNFQTCDLAGILGSLALRVGEVSRNGDNRLIYRSGRGMLLRQPSASAGS